MGYKMALPTGEGCPMSGGLESVTILVQLFAVGAGNNFLRWDVDLFLDYQQLRHYLPQSKSLKDQAIEA